MLHTIPHPPRIDARNRLLAQHGWQDSASTDIPGDASFRHYSRLYRNDDTAILMDAPPPTEDVAPFCRVAALLHERGMRVPHIIGADAEHGYVLLEDIGQNSLASAVMSDEKSELPMYQAAIDALLHLHAQPVPATLAVYDVAVYQREAALLGQWLLPVLEGEGTSAALFMQHLMDAQPANMPPSASPVIVHRDYHAENLFWHHGELVMIDFQDALAGSAAYDLVSLLEDARRDVSPAVVDVMRARYIQASGVDETSFMQEYYWLGAQRNAKILGIFARLMLRDHKPRYVHMIPRVWGYFCHDIAQLNHSGLSLWLNQIQTKYGSILADARILLEYMEQSLQEVRHG